MSGYQAIRGFDYQATVSLHLLLAHFANSDGRARARPEGDDDLDLTDDLGNVVHIQIKKARDNETTRLAAPRPWSLGDAVSEMLPQTLQRLSGNSHRQQWILGDEAKGALQSLLGPQSDDPSFVKPYLKAVHLVARRDAVKSLDALSAKDKWRIEHWTFKPTKGADRKASVSAMIAAFDAIALSSGVPQSEISAYRLSAQSVDASLPDVLSRTELKAGYGREEEVIPAIQAALQDRYGLREVVVRQTLFKNLTGFISDVSKDVGRSFGEAELENVLASVWPTMIRIKTAPPLEVHYVTRPDLAALLYEPAATITEVVGPSGSGKTSLVAEAMHRAASAGGCSTYYAEVFKETAFRDLLVGLAFRLRSVDFPTALGLSSDGRDATATASAAFVVAATGLPSPIVVYFDLVHGLCDDEFYQELSDFASQLIAAGAPLKVVVLAQERSLRDLSAAAFVSGKAVRIDVRGFDMGEFQALSASLSCAANVEQLSEIHELITAGTGRGLLPALASSVSRLDSVQQMFEVANLPAEDRLPAADRRRFQRIHPDLKTAAGNLCCFVLPFQVSEAAAIFRDDPVSGAVVEMRTLGLIRDRSDSAVEMHETIRAGLEQELSSSQREAAHLAIAKSYEERGMLPLNVYHLNRAGKATQAKELVRECLKGQTWGPLLEFAVSNDYISGEEIVSLMLEGPIVAPIHLLPAALEKFRTPELAKRLLDGMTRLGTQGTDVFYRLLAAIEGAIRCDISSVTALFRQSLERNRSDEHNVTLSCLAIILQRRRVALPAECLEFFQRSSDQAKNVLLPLLLCDIRREPLSMAFAFMSRFEAPVESAARGRTRREERRMGHMVSREDVLAFLAALPAVQLSEMVSRRSVSLDAFASLIWANRAAIRQHCNALLGDRTAPTDIITNAVRVLTTLGHSAIETGINAQSLHDGRLKALVDLMPLFSPWAVDAESLTRLVLAEGTSAGDLVHAAFLLGRAHASLGPLLVQLRARQTANQDAVVWAFLGAAVENPFDEAMQLLSDDLDGEMQLRFRLPIVVAARYVPTKASSDLLVKAIACEDPVLRFQAAESLAVLRDADTTQALADQLHIEQTANVAHALAAAYVSCGGRSTSLLASAGSRFPSLKHWQAAQIGRLRDASGGGTLVELALDVSLSWMQRRAAILAAGVLPFESAANRMLVPILEQPLEFVLDANWNLAGHEALFNIVDGVHLYQGAFERLKPVLADEVARYCDAFSGGAWPEGKPAGVDSANWLVKRLVFYGFPTSELAVQRVKGELAQPLLKGALLQALREQRQVAVLTSVLDAADSLWTACRCIVELGKCMPNDSERLQIAASVRASRFYKGSCLEAVLVDCIRDVTRQAPAMAARASASPLPQTARLTVEDVRQALISDGAVASPATPLVVDTRSVAEFKALSEELHPIHDSKRAPEGQDFFRLTHTGHSLGAGNNRRVDNRYELRRRLRPALAAANVYGFAIPWHDTVMAGDTDEAYIKDYIFALLERGGNAEFQDALDRHADAIVGALCGSSFPIHRIQPFAGPSLATKLRSYAAAGTDSFFAAICELALASNCVEVDPLLDLLLWRWFGRFDWKDLQRPQHVEPGSQPWRAFASLTRHPRFGQIPRWQARLEPIAKLNIADFQRETLLEVLRRSPTSYLTAETALLRTTNFAHMMRDSVEALDKTVQEIFDCS
jgi:hypothetical protein